MRRQPVRPDFESEREPGKTMECLLTIVETETMTKWDFDIMYIKQPYHAPENDTAFQELHTLPQLLKEPRIII